MTPVLTATHISHTFEDDETEVRALRAVNLALQPNEFVALVGPSGGGKSTLLRILAGLLRPTWGEVTIHGERVTEPHPAVGMVFQSANLMPWRTVLDNVTLPLEMKQTSIDYREARAHELIDLVGLTGFAHSYPAQLSGGMAQRVAIARALIQQPDVLLLDEPFGALDALTREHLGEELLRIWAARRSTVLMVTHSINEAILLADRILVMSPRPGTIVSDFPVTLPRPRSLKDLHHPSAGELSNAIREAIRASHLK